MLYIIYQVDRADGGPIRAANRDAHFKYLDEHEEILVLGGAMLAEDGVKRLGSVLIINVKNLEEAEYFSRNEPFRKAGYDRVAQPRDDGVGATPSSAVESG